MQSAVYHGWVRHRRSSPVAHTFRYPLYLLYLDLAEIDAIFRDRILWSASRPAVAWFRREDYLAPEHVPLDRAVRDRVEQSTGVRPDGPIRLLTQIRHFGFGFNPVSFYYCFTADGERVAAIVADVSNTPWGERHAYVLAAKRDQPNPRFAFAKTFHVSPFMTMAVDYDWVFSKPGSSLVVHAASRKEGKPFFDATLSLRRATDRDLLANRWLVRYPFTSLRVVAAIYVQALRLWWKGAPVFTHPRHTDPETMSHV